ncbi:hypothetical protein G7047_21195 [Diaphorobacter sp. HDW4A]|uniref:hypothetical protein n=1 Tax=Diaphorobacter sp. HDW4A TaxID=2714924 RepID=UPI00140ADEB4|nr:hypothetical protein [Diaphorobacter sp. HDW4A]QIL82165.1 hypothetical protein G7047_21195 [Diaphorobacter sp. HDW4A]
MTESSPDFNAFNNSLMIAVPVFNRMGHLLHLLESVRASRDVLHGNLYAFDDASYEFDPMLLRRSLDPKANMMRFNQHSTSAERAIERIFRFFVQSQEHQHLALLDSGLIVADDWLHAAQQGFSRSSGLLSLLNTPMHHTESRIGGTPELLIKQSIGLMGTVWSKPVVVHVLQHVPMSKRYAQDVCQFLRALIPLCCLLESRVQHVGVSQQSLHLKRFEHGVGFAPGNAVAAQILSRETEKIILDLTTRK